MNVWESDREHLKKELDAEITERRIKKIAFNAQREDRSQPSRRCRSVRWQYCPSHLSGWYGSA